MRENRTSGSVRGEDGDILTYSARHFVDPAILIQLLQAAVGVCLQSTGEFLQKLSRMLTLAVFRVGEPDRGGCGLCRRPLRGGRVRLRGTGGHPYGWPPHCRSPTSVS